MGRVHSPFTIKWGDNTIVGVENVDVTYTINDSSYNLLDNRVVRIDGAREAIAQVTLLETDVASLAALLPQNFVDNGGVMSTGETVSEANGALDFTASDCGASIVHNDFDVIGCGAPGEVFRLVNARSRFSSVEVDGTIMKVIVEFIAEPANGEAAIQRFKDGTISVVS